MNFRLGTKEDVAAIGNELIGSWFMHEDHEPDFVNRAVLEKSDLNKYFENCFNDSGLSYFLIAEENKEIAGFVKLNIQEIQKFFNESTVLYVDDIYTRENYRGKGVALSLLKEAEKLAKEKNIKWLKARIYSFNKPAQNTFESAGYKNLYSEYFRIVE
jgi:diamine N-acetyltransferase